MRNDRINFKKSCRIHLACSQDELIDTLQYIYFKDGFAYATDSHILVKNYLPEITDEISDDDLLLLEGKFLHKSAYQKIITYQYAAITRGGIICKDKNSYSEVEFRFANLDRKFPNAETIFIPANKNNGDVNTFAISPLLLSKLIQSLGWDKKIILKFSGGNNSPILATSGNSWIRSQGIIMPMSLL